VDNLVDRGAAHGGVAVGEQQGCVAGPVDDAVNAVRRKRGRLVLHL
jgi:hypothetical protein